MDNGSKDLLQDLLGWRANETEESRADHSCYIARKRWVVEQVEGAFCLDLDQCFNSKNQELIADNYDLSRPKVMELVSLFEKIKNGNWTWYLQILTSIEDCKSESGIDFKELADFDDFMVSEQIKSPTISSSS